MAKEKVEVLQVIPEGEGKWLVTSGTKEGVVYQVKLVDGKLTCTCPAGFNGKECKHRRAVWLSENQKGEEQEKQIVEGSETTDGKTQKGMTKLGYQFDEVTSAFHKEVRLGDEEAALWFGFELYETAPNYFWKRVLTQAAEDIGMAAPDVVAQIILLQQAWAECKKFSWYVDPQHVALAILLMCRAPKSTEVDDAKSLLEVRRKRGDRPAIPDYAKDCHTQSGRAMGRGYPEFYQFRETKHAEAGWRSNPYYEKLKQEAPDWFEK